MSEMVEEFFVTLADTLDYSDVRKVDDAAWLIAVDEETAIFAELDVARQVLIFSTYLGFPVADQELVMYEFLLKASFARKEMDGIHMALDPEDGAILQMKEISQLGPEMFDPVGFFSQFLGAARDGRTLIENWQNDGVTGQLENTGLLRV